MTHQELIESAASYALDSLDSDERAQFEAHLAGCPACRTEVAAYRGVAGALAHTAPAAVIQRPDALRERILRDARRGDSTLAALVRPEVHVVSLAAQAGCVTGGTHERIDDPSLTLGMTRTLGMTWSAGVGFPDAQSR